MLAFKLTTLAACLFAISAAAEPFPSSSSKAAGTRVAAGSGTVPYQAYAAKAKCPIATTCLLVFPAITDSGIIIQHASCIVGIKTGGAVGLALLGIGDQTPFNVISANKLPAESDGDLFDISGQTNLFVDVGQQPRITVSSTGKKITGGACTISGVHI